MGFRCGASRRRGPLASGGRSRPAGGPACGELGLVEDCRVQSEGSSALLPSPVVAVIADDAGSTERSADDDRDERSCDENCEPKRRVRRRIKYAKRDHQQHRARYRDLPEVPPWLRLRGSSSDEPRELRVGVAETLALEVHHRPKPHRIEVLPAAALVAAHVVSVPDPLLV